jgi:hypothetical protein
MPAKRLRCRRRIGYQSGMDPACGHLCPYANPAKVGVLKSGLGPPASGVNPAGRSRRSLRIERGKSLANRRFGRGAG